MSSADSKIYPGIAREPGTGSRPDPDDPAKVILTTRPTPYTRRVAVYIPANYIAGTIAPLIVGADGPDPLLFTALDHFFCFASSALNARSLSATYF